MSLVHAAGLAPRVARKSDDYVSEILRRRGGDGNESRLTTEAKKTKMALILQDEVNGE